MHVECGACGARYVIADEKIPAQGVRVRCRKCQAVFSVAKPEPVAPAELPLNQVISLKNFLRDQEHAYLQKVMQQCEGDKEKAALILGVSLATLYRKLSDEDQD